MEGTNLLSKQITNIQSLHSFKLRSDRGGSGKHKFDVSEDEIVPPANNFMISILKYNCLMVLLQLLAGRRPTSYVYYTLRRVLDPDTFRLNFAYQYYFVRKFHKGEYNMKLFFRYDRDVDVTNQSPLIIEIGFNLYFLLMKMQRNLFNDMDEKYYNRIICLLSQKEKAASTIRQNLFMTIVSFFVDAYRLCTRCCKKNYTVISAQKIQHIKNSDREMKNILKFYAEHVSQIEFIKDGVAQNQFFPILPFCRFSSEYPKDKFKKDAVRENAKTKCESLMKESKYLITDLKVNYWLRTGLTRFVGLLQKYLEMLKSLLAYSGLGLNIVILISYTDETGARTHDPALPDASVSFTETFLIVWGCITLFFIFIIFANSLINKIPIKIKRYEVNQAQMAKKLKESGILHELGVAEPVYTKLRAIIVITFSICTDLTLLYYLALFVLTVMGVVWHPFFYTYLLTYLVFRSPALVNVLQAIWYPRETLLLTIALMFMVIYAMTVISFYVYADDYTENDCYSLWTCFVISFDHTFKNDGGLGGYLESAYTQTDDTVKVNIDRVIYDNVAFLLVGILLIGIISGIIIDTFAELREQNNAIMQDARSRCFICDKSREELEKMYGANGFEFHVNQHHNLWDYLFFMAYLEAKMEAEGQLLNSSERYVFEKMDKDDHSWLPCYA